MFIRKFIGAFLILFIAIPILFGVTWVVGLVKASVSPGFLTELPREIIDKIPASVDEIFQAAQNQPRPADPVIRAWFQAAAKTGITPHELMEKTGLLGWMRGELSGSLRQIGEVLRGESPIRSISIDLRPLKNALLHPEMDKYLEGTLANLPLCDAEGLKAWQARAAGFDSQLDLPPCRPDLVLAKDILLSERTRAVRNMDDSVQVLEDIRPFPFDRFGITRTVILTSYLLFLIPAIIILLSVLIATPSPAGRLRWAGISILAGGVPALVLAFGIKKFTFWALGSGYFSWHTTWTTDFGRLVMDKLRWIPLQITDRLFSPVVGVAAVVAVVGVVLLALSASARSKTGVVKS